MASEKTFLILKTFDNNEFVVETSVANLSKTIKNIVEDTCVSSVISVPNVDGKTMAKIIEYCKKHVEESDQKVLKEFDAQFVDLDQAELYDLMMGAHFLEIEDLLERVTDKVADMMKGKSPEEIRNIFMIENDLTPEETEAARKENSWAREQ